MPIPVRVCGLCVIVGLGGTCPLFAYQLNTPQVCGNACLQCPPFAKKLPG